MKRCTAEHLNFTR